MFIPLKEWKQRKLQHIESRVRNGQIRHSATPQPFPRSFHSFNFCRRPTPLLIFSRHCCLHEPVNWKTQPQPSHKVDSTSKLHQAHASLKPKPSRARHKENQSNHTATPTERLRSNTEQDNISQLHAHEPSHSDLPIRIRADAASDELPGTRDQNISALNGLPIPKLPDVMPRVGSIVRSIMDASYLFSAPPIPVTSASKRVTHPSQRLSATNISTSNSSNTASTRTRFDSSAYSKPKHNSSARLVNRSPSRESSTADHPALKDPAIQHNLQEVKEKPFNFAAADAGARILAYSDGVVGAKNVLIGSVDKYLLAPCEGAGLAGSRWVDLELSEDVILESIETANFEYYSSSARKVAVLGAGSYPPKKWNVLGVFDFRNIKTVQRFQISKRVVTRFLRVVYAGKQGNEYYCPVSTIRAFGKNLIADWKDVFEKPRTDGEELSFSQKNHETEAEVGSASKAASSHSDDPDTVRTRTSLPEVAKMEKAPVPTEGIPPRISAHPTMDGNLDEQIDDKTSESGREGRGASLSVDDVTLHHSVGEKEAEDSHADPSVSSEGNHKTQKHQGTPNTESAIDGSESDIISDEDRIVMEAVRADTLTPVSGDDNIFRKVTRMIQLLELNQTLTNQYIDSQLSKFAKALSTAQSRSSAVEERVALVEKQLMQVVFRLDARVDELLQSNYRRDIMMCLLLVSMAFLVGAQCVLWTSVSGARLRYSAGQPVFGVDSEPEEVEPLLQTEEVGSPITTKNEFQVEKIPFQPRRKKKKFKRLTTSERLNEAEDIAREDGDNRKRWHGRSASSVELVSLRLPTQTIRGSGGAFHVLRSNGGS